MSSFTEKLIVSKISNKYWEVERSFEYYVGEESNPEYIEVPAGFKTDFASVPRMLWNIIPPDGNYTQAAVLHDYMYFRQLFKRSKCDKIFLEAMEVLKVSLWKRKIMYQSVRLFGWIGWGRHDKKNN